MNNSLRWFAAVQLLLCVFISAPAQDRAAQPALVDDLRELVETPAVPGYEHQLAVKIADKLKSFAPKIDAQNNVTVTIGQGAPHRLVVAPIDEPGFVTGGITNDG